MKEHYDTGYIYFIRAGDDLAIKIGNTIAPLKERMLQLQTANHRKLALLGAIDLRKLNPDQVLNRVQYSLIARKKEAEIQAKFADARIHGEWFNLTPELVLYISQVTNIS